MQEQGTHTAFDRARMMWLTVFKEEEAIVVVCAHRRRGIFSDVLHFHISSTLRQLVQLTGFARAHGCIRICYCIWG